MLFTDQLRKRVQDCAEEMHQLFRRGHTPKVKPAKFCNACSLKDLCLPGLMRKRDVAEYLKQALEKEL